MRLSSQLMPALFLISTILLASPRVSASTEINEVIVLANKREQVLTEIPMSLSVIDAKVLARTGIENIQDIEKVTSGLRIRDVGNDPKIIMRGAGSAGTYKHDPAVPVYVDGLYRPLLSQSLASFLDVGRLEILRGPQGTLFGRNTLGGVVSIVTNKPDFDSAGVSFEGTIGGYDLSKVTAIANLPVSDTLALRLSAASTKHDPYLVNIYDASGGMVDADNEIVKAQIRFASGLDSDLTVSATSWRDQANGSGEFGYKVIGVPVNPVTKATNGLSGVLDPRGGLRDGWQGGRDVMGTFPVDQSAAVIPDNRQISTDYRPNRKIKEDTITVAYSLMVGGGELQVNAGHFNYSGYNILDADFSTAGTYIISGRDSGQGWISGQTRDSESNQIDANFSIESGWLQVTAGVFYFDQEQSYNWIFGTTTDVAPQKVNWASWPNDSFQFTAESAAIYAQAVVALSDRVDATIGGRYSEDKRSSLRLVVDPSTAQGTPRPFHVSSGDPLSRGDDSHFDYRIALMYELSETVSAFASLSTGYMSGEVQAGTGSLLDASENDALELGLKARLLGDSMTVSVTAYHSKYENLTTSLLFLIPESDVYGSRSVPGGGMESRGIEFDASWRPTSELALSASVTLDDSEFREFFKRYVYTETDGNSRITVLDDGSKTMDVSGLETPFAPDFTASLSGEYRFELGRYGVLTPSATVYWSDSYNTETIPYFWSHQKSFVTLDVAMTWQLPSRDVTLQAYVANVTDEDYFTGSDTFSKERAVVQFNDPRTWGLRFKLSL